MLMVLTSPQRMTYKRQKARRLSSRAFEKRDLDGVPGDIARDAWPIKSGKSPRPTSVVHAAFAVKSHGAGAIFTRIAIFTGM
jgi:hypothetical protein